MKIEMLKGAANPSSDDLIILTFAEVSTIRTRLESVLRERDETMEALEKCREDSICYAEHMRRCGYVAAYKESTENVTECAGVGPAWAAACGEVWPDF